MCVPPSRWALIRIRSAAHPGIAVLAAPAYLMAVAGNADPMLGYLTTSFREHPRIRDKTKKRITTAMQARFMEQGVMDPHGGLLPARPHAEDLYGAYLSGGGDKRGSEALRAEGVRKLAKLRERGLDLGYDNYRDYTRREILTRASGESLNRPGWLFMPL